MYRLFLIVIALLLFAGPVMANGKKVTKIVLDPGHGGAEPGARGKFSWEKDITLAVSLRLGKMLKDSMKDVQVIYTRTTDVYPQLAERHAIANRADGDIFISVHVNSSASRQTKASGTETFVLGLHRNPEKEEAIGEYSDMVVEEPGLLNMNDPQTAIIIAQYTQAFLSRSVSLGSKIQSAFSSQGRVDRGVKQMGLEVLAGSAMPGVLVEIGFINNPDEEVYLNSEQGQTDVAYAIYKGIKAYKEEVEKK